VLPTEGRTGFRRRRLLRLGWPWPVIAIAGAVGGALTGLPGSLVLAGVAAFLYGAFSRVGIRHSPEPRWHLVACVLGLGLGTSAILLGGYLGGTASLENS
jgi:hypothetical protein